MKRSALALAALALALTGCAADKPAERTSADYVAACVDVVGPQFNDAKMTRDYCDEAIGNALEDPAADTSKTLLDLLDKYLDE